MRTPVVPQNSNFVDSASEIVLEVQDLKKYFAIRKGFREVGAVRALDGVSFQLRRNSTLAVVGESGCGKSTLAKLLMQIEKPTGGDITLHGKSLAAWSAADVRRKIQMVFQDPFSSLNPRRKILDSIAEPLDINLQISKSERHERVMAMLTKVGLNVDTAMKYPHMLSGGQRQRVGIARALVLQPEILICDEPVSALDVSIQAQVLNLLMDLQAEMNLTLIFISHDLPVVRHMADEIVVMYLGKIVEMGRAPDVFSDPQHPYTQALLKSHLSLDGSVDSLQPLRGEIPSPLKMPTGCGFHTRCSEAQDKCKVDVPLFRKVNDRHLSCHFRPRAVNVEAAVNPSHEQSV